MAATYRPEGFHTVNPYLILEGAGAVLEFLESLQEPADMYYGERGAGVRDPGGNQRWLATTIEEMSFEEAERRKKEAGGQRLPGHASASVLTTIAVMSSCCGASPVKRWISATRARTISPADNRGSTPASQRAKAS